MSDDIHAALTSEEWASIDLAAPKQHKALASMADERFESFIARKYDTDDNVAVIALLNAALPDFDPRKITHERLDRAWNMQTGDDETEDFLTALRSYLPPRQP